MLSQTAEYALRAMAILAYSPDELVPTPKLAEETKVPSNYLAKVLQLLAGDGLIIGRRGVGGGYRLARPAGEISMLKVVNAVESVERICSCPLELPNHTGALCPLHHKLDEAIAAVQKVFGDTSLQDLISDPESPRPLCNVDPFADMADVTISAAAHANGNGTNHGNGVPPQA
ncbi:MAG: Rrf2 family transcriptional regulator [Planctomycetota bacterium]